MHPSDPYRAHYTDGRTADRHAVRVQPGQTALTLFDDTGAQIAVWPYAGLRLIEEVYGDRPGRLRHAEHGEAVLTVAHPRLLAELEQRAGRRLRGHALLRPSLKLAGVALVLLAAVVAGAFWAVPRLAAPAAHWVPVSWETALGEQVVANLAASRRACRAPAGRAALAGLAERLVQPMRLPYGINVQVLDDPAVNALAAPGGQVLLFRGLLQAAESPDEVAGVLAHELAHVQERHPMRGVLRALGLSLLLSALLGDSSALDARAAQVAQLLLLFSYTRQDELAADRGGVRLLRQAGLNARGLGAFLQRMAERQGNAQMPALFSTHPVHQERVEALEDVAASGEAALTPAQWEALRTICAQ